MVGFPSVPTCPLTNVLPWVKQVPFLQCSFIFHATLTPCHLFIQAWLPFTLHSTLSPSLFPFSHPLPHYSDSLSSLSLSDPFSSPPTLYLPSWPNIYLPIYLSNIYAPFLPPIHTTFDLHSLTSSPTFLPYHIPSFLPHTLYHHHLIRPIYAFENCSDD